MVDVRPSGDGLGGCSLDRTQQTLLVPRVDVGLKHRVEIERDQSADPWIRRIGAVLTLPSRAEARHGLQRRIPRSDVPEQLTTIGLGDAIREEGKVAVQRRSNVLDEYASAASAASPAALLFQDAGDNGERDTAPLQIAKEAFPVSQPVRNPLQQPGPVRQSGVIGDACAQHEDDPVLPIGRLQVVPAHLRSHLVRSGHGNEEAAPR